VSVVRSWHVQHRVWWQQLVRVHTM
jgi:hypothetical protein